MYHVTSDVETQAIKMAENCHIYLQKVMMNLYKYGNCKSQIPHTKLPEPLTQFK